MLTKAPISFNFSATNGLASSEVSPLYSGTISPIIFDSSNTSINSKLCLSPAW